MSLASKPILTDPYLILGTTIGQNYRVDRIVAAGGFGVVYAGWHVGLDVPIAVKIVRPPSEARPELRDKIVASFVTEAKTSAKLKHPHIVQVLDVGSANTAQGVAAFMVFEWLDGETLKDDLHRRRGKGGRSPAEAVALLRPAFEALAFAHEEMIAHRDVKPANIMLVPTRRGVSMRVLDFGIAKTMRDDDEAGSGVTQTSSAVLAYSPRYAAPEQVSRTRTGPWTDVHALGLIMTEALTDQPAYRGSDPAELLQQTVMPERPTPARRGKNVGPLEAVLQKALAFRPDDRYRSAGEMLAAIDAALAKSGSIQGRAVDVPAKVVAPPGAEVSNPPVAQPSTPSSAALDDSIPSVEPAAVGLTTLHSAIRVDDSHPSVGATPSRRVILIAGAAVLVAVVGVVVGTSLHSASAPHASPVVHAAAVTQPPAPVPPIARPSITPAPSPSPVAPQQPATVAPAEGATTATTPTPASSSHPSQRHTTAPQPASHATSHPPASHPSHHRDSDYELN